MYKNFVWKKSQLLWIDNRRVVHGRTEFLQNTWGFWNSQGTYICELNIIAA